MTTTKLKVMFEESQCSSQLRICLGRMLLELNYRHKLCETVLEELILTAYDRNPLGLAWWFWFGTLECDHA